MFIIRKTTLYMQPYMFYQVLYLVECLHKCMENIPYKAACTI